MNHDLISALAPKEYYKAFIEKNIRPDKRLLKEKRGVQFYNNALESEEYSCTCCLGEGNRILAVLKVNFNEKKQSKILNEKSSLMQENNKQIGEEKIESDDELNIEIDYNKTSSFNIITDFCDNTNLYFDGNDILSYTDKLLK